MLIRSLLGTSLCIFSLLGIASGETDGNIDFRRDVQPLIEKNCIGCHGPEQQMNSFRLDRRSSALRGGTRNVIVPGNSAASRLYLRLINDHFGKRMPATGPLQPNEVAIFKEWIDQGAKWPDDLANELVLTPPDPKAIRMVEALRTGDSTNFWKLVGEDARTLNTRGPGGATPFMYAVLYSDAASIKRLLAKDADPNKKSDAGATALMWAVNDPAKTQALLDHGANVNAISNDGRTSLVIAAAQARSLPIVQALLKSGATADLKGTSALREAAVIGDADVMELLIAHRASIKTAGSGALAGAIEVECWKCLELIAKQLDAKAYTDALLSVAVTGKLGTVKYMLDHGANVNAADTDGRTPLMYASNNDRLPIDTVKLLLDRGANVNAKNSDGGTALSAARLHGETPIVALLVKAGGTSSVPVETALKYRKENTIPEAIQRALPLIQTADLNFTRKSGCVSCHNEALSNMAISTARKSGFRIDEPMAKQEVKAVTSFFSEWRERLLQGLAPGGPAYILEGLHAEQYKPDLLTDSIARYIKMHQLPDGHWGPGCGGSRNPLCGDPVTNTANSLRALQFYAPVTDPADYSKSIQLAAEWLAKAPVYTHEDRTFRVFGLAWADRDKDALKAATHDLLATQRPDGGWSDNAYMPSTSYATGEAMVALHDAGLPILDSAWQRGVQFLLKTQLEDGSWYVRSHSYGTQPYFDNGFPHGQDQWISAAGTNWATIALSLAAAQKPGEANQVAHK